MEHRQMGVGEGGLRRQDDLGGMSFGAMQMGRWGSSLAHDLRHCATAHRSVLSDYPVTAAARGRQRRRRRRRFRRRRRRRRRGGAWKGGMQRARLELAVKMILGGRVCSVW